MHRTLDMNAVLARIELIADALGLPQSEIDGARCGADDDPEPLVSFAQRYGQSLDWIVLGDVRPYIIRAANNAS